MGFRLPIDEFNNLLNNMRLHYRIWAPVAMAGQGAYSDTDLVTELSEKGQVAEFIDFGGYFYDREHALMTR